MLDCLARSRHTGSFLCGIAAARAKREIERQRVESTLHDLERQTTELKGLLATYAAD